MSWFFSFYSSRAHPHLHSFPTRRSSDLLHGEARAEGGDLLWLDHDTLAVGQGFRTNAEALTNCQRIIDRKSTRLNSSHSQISYAVFCLKKKNIIVTETSQRGVDGVEHVP